MPAALLAMTQSPTMLGWVLGLYVLIQGLESCVVTPLVLHKAVALPPALIITIQILFSVAVGWLGLLLATPLIACIVVLIEQFFVEAQSPAAPPRAELDVAA